MKKLIWISTLASTLLFASTSKQVEAYLSLSHADRELIEIELMFDSMKNSLETKEDNSSKEMAQVYQEYLETHISKNEMDKLLELYRTPIMRRYVVEMDTIEIPKEEMNSFLNSLEETPLSSERMDIIDNLVTSLFDEESLLKFYDTMTQRYRSKKSENRKTSTDKEPSKQEKAFLKSMKEGLKNELLYGTQVLSMEEMKELNSTMKKGIMLKVSKIESEALSSIMNQFIQRITSDIKKKDDNQSKEATP